MQINAFKEKVLWVCRKLKNWAAKDKFNLAFVMSSCIVEHNYLSHTNI